MEILVAQRLCRKLEDNASVRTYDGLLILAVAAKVLEIAAAADGFHQRVEHHHGLGADAASVLVNRAPVCACVFVTDLFAVAAVMLGRIAVQKTGYLNCEFVFLVIPLFHNYTSVFLVENYVHSVVDVFYLAYSMITHLLVEIAVAFLLEDSIKAPVVISIYLFSLYGISLFI